MDESHLEYWFIIGRILIFLIIPIKNNQNSKGA